MKFVGRVYERLLAWKERRKAQDLYHAALEVFVEEGLYAIEGASVVDDQGEKRGVVMEGAVGWRWAGRWRIFRYEWRRWREGVIPDLAEAVEGSRRLSNSLEVARKLLDLMPEVPRLVWGRDEIKAGEMWTSNSQMAWLLEKSGLEAERIEPPKGGRAPGWKAGVVAARGETF